MNRSKSIQFFVITLLAIAMFTACKKDEPEEVITDSAPVQQLSTDDKLVGDGVDEVIIDAAIVLNGNNLKNLDLPCNAHLDTVFTINDTIHYHISYNGLNCAQNRHRTGMLVLKLKQNAQWLHPGAGLIIEFHNYHVTQVFNGKSIYLNGMASIENVSGGVIPLIGNGVNTVIQRIMAHIRVSFNEQVPRQWHLTKMIVYSGMQGNLLMAVNGFGKADGYNNLLSWGEDRHGNRFYTQVTEPITFREQCNWDPSSGEQIFSIPDQDLKATARFGFNNQNKPVMGNDCPTRFRLRWQQHGHSGTIFLPMGGKL